jgi:hypothetical protein
MDRGRRPLGDDRGASRADQPQVKIGLGGRVTRAILVPAIVTRTSPSLDPSANTGIVEIASAPPRLPGRIQPS